MLGVPTPGEGEGARKGKMYYSLDEKCHMIYRFF